MRRTKTVRIGELISDFVASSPTITRGMAQAKIASLWPGIVGPGIAPHTSSITFRKGTMYVTVTSSVVRSELFMRRLALRDTLNRAVGIEVVENIVIK